MTGIYKVVAPDGGVYIGQSVNIKKRWEGHGGKRASGHPLLHESYVIFGIKNHVFSVLHESPRDIDREILFKYETFYRDLYKSSGHKSLNLHGGGVAVKTSVSDIVLERRFTPRHTVEDVNKKIPSKSYLIGVERVGNSKIKCSCKCGNFCTIAIAKLISGRTASCGCYMRELAAKKNRKYSHTIPQIYHSWHSMVDRCYNEKNTRFNCYGKIGVIVCEQWRTNYQNFLDWSLANGWKKGLQIDKDIKGDSMLYSPENCLWVTPKKNANKRSTCVFYDYFGEKLSFTEICEKEGLNRERVRHHIRKNKKGIYEAINIVKQKP